MHIRATACKYILRSFLKRPRAQGLKRRLTFAFLRLPPSLILSAILVRENCPSLTSRSTLSLHTDSTRGTRLIGQGLNPFALVALLCKTDRDEGIEQESTSFLSRQNRPLSHSLSLSLSLLYSVNRHRPPRRVAASCAAFGKLFIHRVPRGDRAVRTRTWAWEY